jgi:hypothetical protein
VCDVPRSGWRGRRDASIKGVKEADVLKAVNDGKGKMKPVKIDDAAAVAKWVSGLK